MRRLCIFILSITVMFAVHKKENARAATWAVGVLSYYAQWEPAFEGMYQNFEVDPLLMIGPGLSVTTEGGWTFSGSFLGNFLKKNDISLDQDVTGNSGPGTVHGEAEYERVELDLTVSYRLHRSFSIFTGIKITESTIILNSAQVTSGSYTFQAGDEMEPNIFYTGWGIGGTFSYSLFSGCSAILGVSGLYSKTDINLNQFVEQQTGQLDYGDVSGSGNGIGCNITMSLAHYISALHLAVSVGGRYQYLHYFGASDDITLEDDTLYGITMSALFVF